jgi:hypothetical protein
MARTSAGTSGSCPGLTRASTLAASSEIAPSSRRNARGNSFNSAVILARSQAGMIQSSSPEVSCGKSASGTLSVTPSSSAVGSKR